MALSSYISTCICCSLLTGCIFSGIATMFLYILAFSIEVWWIIEARVQLPLPAYLLTLVYFFLAILSIFMLLGLRTKKTRLVLAWIVFFLLAVFPEGGMVVFMAVYYWEGGVYAVIELTLWVCRALVSIVGTICIHSLYCAWKEEKSVLRALKALEAKTGGFYPHGIAGEYQKTVPGSYLAYQNAGYRGSIPEQIHDGRRKRSAMAITKYSSSSKPSSKHLKRSLSAASGFVYASRLSLNEIGLVPQQFAHMPLSDQLSTAHRQLSRVSLNITQSGYSKTEFDTSKFSSKLVSNRSMSQWDLPSFGLDPDAPVFLPPGSYGRGGRPLKGQEQKTSGKAQDRKLQWYRPRSLGNLVDEDDSIWIGMQPPIGGYNSQKLSSQYKAHSLGRLNFGDTSEEAILYGGIGPYYHFRQEMSSADFPQGSRISLGQYSDNVDHYRDVAL